MRTVSEDQEARKARAAAALQLAVLVVLLERNGGSVTFTESEYQAIVARYGGSSLMAVHHEVLAMPGEAPDEVRFTLVRKAAGQGELPA